MGDNDDALTEHLNERQMARLYGIKMSTARKWRREGRGPRFRKLGVRTVRYSRADLLSWLGSRPTGGENSPRSSPAVCALDVAAVQRYFAGLEALAREARGSDDPRVLADALRVMELQPATAAELLCGGETSPTPPVVAPF
jgi:predicted DNA-binding transcriptional regulator AlpA